MSHAIAASLPTPLTGPQGDLLSRFVADADRNALLWASGYLAGAARALDAHPLALATAATPQAQASQRLTVLYGSQTGAFQ